MDRKGLLACLPRFKDCCCLFNLRLGAIIIGILYLLSCILGIIGFYTSPDEGIRYVPIILFLPILGLILAWILIVSVVKRSVACLKFSIVINLFFSGFLALLFLLHTIFRVNFSANYTIDSLIMIFTFGIHLYFVFCLNSYLQQILDENTVILPTCPNMMNIQLPIANPGHSVENQFSVTPKYNNI